MKGSAHKPDATEVAAAERAAGEEHGQQQLGPEIKQAERGRGSPGRGCGALRRWSQLATPAVAHLSRGATDRTGSDTRTK